MSQNFTEIKAEVNKLLREPTILFLDDIELTGEIIRFILNSENLNKIYLLGNSYNDNSEDSLKKEITNKEIKCISKLSYDVIEKENIIFCLNNSNLLNYNYQQIEKNKKVKGICFIGFTDNWLGSRPKSKNIKIYYCEFLSFLKNESLSSYRIADQKPQKTSECYNRTEEKKALDFFLANNRFLVIHGFSGYGKNNFLEYLVNSKAPNRNYFFFNFQDSTETYKSIIYEFAPYFSMIFTQDELNRTSIEHRVESELVREFIMRFNSKDNVTLVFDNVQKVLQRNKNETELPFDLNLFFDKLICDKNFNPTNNIIFLSSVPYLGNKNTKTHLSDIMIGELQPFYIKRIMADAYQRHNKPELAIKIATYDDYDVIQELTCGHPELTLTLVGISLRHDIDQILKNVDYRKQVGYEFKIKWLLNTYKLEEDERRILETIGLFTNDVPFDFLKEFLSKSDTNTFTAIENLTSRYLLSAKSFKNGNIKYFVPNLIKDYVLGITPENDILKNHALIAEYYWSKAEDIKTSSYLKMFLYKNSFYHFKHANQLDKLKQLVFRFKDTFMLEAWEYSRKGKWKEAFVFFNELHLMHEIGEKNDKDYTQFLKVLTKLEQKSKYEERLIEDIHKMFPDDNFISNTYAEYLYDKNTHESLEQALNECKRIMGHIEKSKVVKRGYTELDKAIIENTMVRSLIKLGKLDEAKKIIKKREKYYDEKGFKLLSGDEKYNFQALLLSYYKSMDFENSYFNFKENILSENNFDTLHIPFLEKKQRKTFCLEGNQSQKILNQYETILSFKKDETYFSQGRDKFIKNILDLKQYMLYSTIIKGRGFKKTSVIENNIHNIEILFSEALRVLNKIKLVSSQHTFTSEIELCLVFKFEADFFLVKESFRE